jgi:hypothetical protein
VPVVVHLQTFLIPLGRLFAGLTAGEIRALAFHYS